MLWVRIAFLTVTTCSFCGFLLSGEIGSGWWELGFLSGLALSFIVVKYYYDHFLVLRPMETSSSKKT